MSIRELSRRCGIDRNTVRRALRSDRPPRYQRRAGSSKLDVFTDEIHDLLRRDPKLPAVRVKELIEPLGFGGGQTIVNDYLRAVRPLFDKRRTYQRTIYRPGAVQYIGTFGSFIGFSFAFGQVLLVQFNGTFDTPIKAAYLTFIGPLIGSLIRPVGGKLADRFGGSRVTLLNFVATAASASVVLIASLDRSLPLFLVGFISLFCFSGLGNGSTYKMIPSIFRAKALRAIAAGRDEVEAEYDSRRLSAGLIGLAGAVGAFGGVLVNLAFRQSFLSTGHADAAYVAFIGFYVVCVALTWFVYLRPAPSRLDGV